MMSFIVNGDRYEGVDCGGGGVPMWSVNFKYGLKRPSICMKMWHISLLIFPMSHVYISKCSRHYYSQPMLHVIKEHVTLWNL